MLKLVKKDPVLATGIILPVVLVLLFWLFAELPKYFVEPPKYKAILTLDQHNPSFVEEAQFFVVDGKLRVKYRDASLAGGTSYYRQVIYMYDPATDSSEIIDVQLPNAEKEWKEIEVSAMEDKKIDSSTTAPDGYKVNFSEYRGGFGLGLLFTGSYDNSGSLEKNGRSVIIKTPGNVGKNYYLYNQKFIGWVIE